MLILETFLKIFDITKTTLGIKLKERPTIRHMVQWFEETQTKFQKCAVEDN